MDDLLTDLRLRHPDANPSPESMREHYMNAYHPNRSEGCFAQKVILVEGATEQYALPMYAEALGYRFDELNIAVVDCGGKGSMDRLYRVFNELGIACFMLFDYDAGLDDADNLAKSRELLELVGEDTEAPTDVVVHRSVACFPRKWEDTLREEVTDIEMLTAQARRDMGLRDDSGKPLVARYIARRLTERDPVFVPPSITRVIQGAVAVEWHRSCLRHDPTTVEVEETEEPAAGATS